MPPMLLVGIGVGTAFPSLMTLAMSGAGPSDAGLASGVVNTSMQVGGAIGLAVLATLASQRTDAIGSSASHLSALNSGYHLAYVVGAALVAVALVVAVTVLRAPAPIAASEAEHDHEHAAAGPALSEFG
jgi:MFS family permease